MTDTAIETVLAADERPMEGVDESGRPWKRIPLETPLKRGPNEYREVILRKPLGGDCKSINLTALHQANVDSLAILLPRVTEPTLSAQEVYRMGVDDLGEFGGAVIGFLLTRKAKAELGLTE